MLTLNANECRVLGVLVEKAHTSSQYPMSLNAVTVGCNQLSNRDPVLSLDEDRVMTALDSLREKKLVIFADTLNSRVTKYRHNCRDVLGVETPELVILAELLLRGPQTLGELRARASRMHPLESIQAVSEALGKLINRPEPMCRMLPPLPGSRAERYAQLLCPALHRLDEPTGATAAQFAPPTASPAPGAPAHAAPPASDDLRPRVEALERELATLRQAVSRLAEALGENDLLK